MIKVPIEQLQMGQLIGKAVCTADGSVLLTPGTIVADDHIKLLFENGISFVQIMEPEILNSGENDFIQKEIADIVKDIFRDITLLDQLEQGIVKQTVNDMLRRVLKDRSALFHLTEVRSIDSYVFCHSVNVCMLSVVLGLFMKLKGNQLKKLGLAALLHDVGRTKVSPNLLYKPSALTDEEYMQVKKHSQHGHDILKTCRYLPVEVATTALHHHERIDGSGYPAGLKGDEISFFGRIVAVADVFDALIADRPFRKAFFPHQAVEIIVNSSNQYDSEILKVFINHVAIYPMGTMVSLNNGEIGIVVDMNKGQQTRPVIRVLFDDCANRLQSIKEIDLSKHSTLFITRVIKEEQMKQLISI